MFFLKKFLLGFGALFLILLGVAGTQSQSTLLQGGGFLGLIIGLVVLYIFAKMAWRAMGCLPSVFLILAIVVFIVYAIGGFKNGIGNVGANLRSFIGQSSTSKQVKMANASQQSGVIALLEEEDFEAPISESFSAPAANAEQLREMPAQPVPAQNRQPRRQPQEEPGFLDKLFGGESSDQKGFNPQDYPAVYSAAGVVTGDTLTLNGRYFRLYGIDAPESNQTCADAVGRSYSCGRQAAAWLSSWLQDNTLECRVMQQDAKGNMVGTCSLGAYDLGAALVNAGWAVAYTKYTDIYVPYQVQAQENGRGLWQGEFYMPWDWRKLQARKPNIKIIKTKPKRKRTFLNPMG